MRKIIFMLVALLSLCSTTYAQCIKTAQYPSTAVAVTNTGFVQSVTTCIYSTQYSLLTGLLVGSKYTFTGGTTAVPGNLTVTDVNNTVIAFGPSPLTIDSMTTDQVRVHLSDDALCASSTGTCKTITVQVILTCPIPLTQTVSGITTTGASFAWSPGGTETAWETIVLPATAAIPVGTTAGSTAVTSNPVFSTTTLTQATQYKFYTRANCGTEFSPWSTALAFTTACNPVTNFSENFDSATSTATFPLCWSRLIRGTGVQYATIALNTTAVSSAPYSVSMYNSNATATDDIMLISPNISTLQGTVPYRLKFKAKNTTVAPGSIQVGTIDGVGPTATFNSIETIAISNITTEYVVNFSGYVGTDTNVAIRFNTTGTYNYIYLDDIKWEPVPTCADVTAFTLNEVNATTATFEWTNGQGETSWNVAIGETTATDPSTLTFVTSTEETKTVTGLTASTTYKAWVRSVCSATDNGAWIGPITFKTDCTAVAVFSESFDSVTAPALPNCWGSIKRGPSLGDYTTVTTNQYTAVSSAPNALQFYNSNAVTTVNDIMAVSPNLSTLGAGTHRLKFSARGPGVIQIGTLSSSTATAEFNNMEEITLVGSTVSEYIVDFAPYLGGTDRYIGIRMANTVTYSYDYIDNIVWELTPTCSDVSVVQTEDVNTTTASFSWEAGGSEAAWDIAVGAPTVTDANTLTFVSSTITNKTVTGLTEATNYKAWVRSSCSATDKGAWIGPILFKTDCLPVATFNENLESLVTPALPACWTTIKRGPTSSTAYIQSYAYYTVNSAPNSLNLYSANADTDGLDDVILVSPNLSTAGLGTYRLKFWAKGYSANSVQVGTLSSSTGTAVFTPVETIATTTVATQYVVNFTDVTTDRYIGIRMNGTATYTSVYLDDLVWELAPTCSDVTGIIASEVTTSTATISWNPGGTETAWQVVVGETTVTDPSTITTTYSPTTPEQALTGLLDAHTYKVWVRSMCAGNDNGFWQGPITFTTQCLPTAVPYTENFETAVTPALPSCSKAIKEGLANIWSVVNSPSNYGFTSKALYYPYTYAGVANTWFFTRGVLLTAGTEYAISYRYGTNTSGSQTYTEKLKIAYGTDTTVDAMTETLADHVGITGPAVAETVNFTPATTATYYFGFQCYSAAGQNNLYLDDILVDVALATGNLETNNFSYYPNPVKNVLNLSYNQNITAIAVYNMLGQKVLENTINANTAAVDMSTLSVGNYIVKVTADNQTKTIKVIKE